MRSAQPFQDGVVPRYLPTEAHCQEGQCPSQSGDPKEGAEPGEKAAL